LETKPLKLYYSFVAVGNHYALNQCYFPHRWYSFKFFGKFLHLILHFHYCLCIWKFLPFNSFCFLQPFPWFRMGYFCLWTVTYVIFQWIVHACINLWYNKPLFLVLTQLLRRRKTHYYTLLSNTSFLVLKTKVALSISWFVILICSTMVWTLFLSYYLLKIGSYATKKFLSHFILVLELLYKKNWSKYMHFSAFVRNMIFSIVYYLLSS
jgi:hypothetical protein